MAALPDQFTAATHAALAQMRAPGSMHWGVVALLAIVSYIYTAEFAARRYRAIAAGLAVWFADWINEIFNSAILHISGHAALWTETGGTFYQITVGLNAESTFMFAFAGIVYARMLPEDARARIAGMNNRLAIALGISVLSVAVEVVLWSAGIFHWYYRFWNAPWGLPVIVVAGYLWFYMAAAWAHDAPTVRGAFGRAGALGGTALALGTVFALAGWL